MTCDTYYLLYHTDMYSVIYACCRLVNHRFMYLDLEAHFLVRLDETVLVIHHDSIVILVLAVEPE